MFCKAIAVKPDNQVARTNLRNLFTEECPNSFSDNSSPSLTPVEQDIGAMVRQAIAVWQSQTGRSINEREKDRIVNLNLSEEQQILCESFETLFATESSAW